MKEFKVSDIKIGEIQEALAKIKTYSDSTTQFTEQVLGLEHQINAYNENITTQLDFISQQFQSVDEQLLTESERVNGSIIELEHRIATIEQNHECEPSEVEYVTQEEMQTAISTASETSLSLAKEYIDSTASCAVFDLMTFLPKFNLIEYEVTSIVVPMNHNQLPIEHIYGNQISNNLEQLIEAFDIVDFYNDTVIINWSLLVKDQDDIKLLNVPSAIMSLNFDKDIPTLEASVKVNNNYFDFIIGGDEIEVNAFVAPDTSFLNKECSLIITSIKVLRGKD